MTNSTNLPGAALKTSWNETVFGFEFLSTFLLIFFTYSWMLIAILAKKNKSKIFIAFGYTAATALAFFLPWAVASVASKKPVYPMLNLLIVLFQSFIRGFGEWGQSNRLEPIGKPLVNGLPYILGAQFLGGMTGFMLFVAFFYAVKFIFKNNDEYKELQNLTLFALFKKDYEFGLLSYTIKEFIFITLFLCTIPFIGMIDTTNYQLNGFQIVLIQIFVIGIILFFSLFFNFFAIHLFFNFVELLVKTIEFIKLPKNDKNAYKKNYLIIWAKFTIVLIISILMPIVVALISILIKIKSGAVIAVS
ncbi:MAG4940 family membrane protein [Mycoplasmopsis primatum]|uniref:MAG4940 family membrane protein n=1 Tax=Mycoplasmopsis primatum TaxID=55604 RepID=UPI000495CB2F|nr:hypothetical protein [Mycoplasmopsis primatum]